MPMCLRGTLLMTFVARLTLPTRVMNTRLEVRDAGRRDHTPTVGHRGKISCTRMLTPGAFPWLMTWHVMPNLYPRTCATKWAQWLSALLAKPFGQIWAMDFPR